MTSDSDSQTNGSALPEDDGLTDALLTIFGNQEEGDMGSWDLDPATLEDRDLNPEEMLIVALFLKGLSYDQIAEATKHSLAYVNNAIALPKAQRLITKTEQICEEELRGMKSIAVSAVRDILLHGDDKAKTAMVEKYFKIVGRFNDDNNRGQSAEDIIAKMLNIMDKQTDITRGLTSENRKNIIEASPIEKDVIDVTPEMEKKEA